MKFLRIILIFFFATYFGQDGFQVSNGKKTVIPFQFINNLVFIPVNINGVDLTFLLDSGVNETILFSLENKDVNFNNVEKIKFSGLGETKTIEGLKSENNLVSIGKNLKDSKHTVFIILDQDINFSAHIGIPVNGIIGYEFFQNHPVQIDFNSKKITVFNDEHTFLRKSKKFQEFPITIEGNKPYITAGVEMVDKRVDSKMLIDLGNSDAVWLFPKLIDNFVYNRPNIEDYLGQGFNGDIYGKRSRIHRLYLRDFVFEKPLTAMPDEYSIQNLRLVPDRKGSVGSEILRRFFVIFNYPEKKIYLRKNGHYKDPFLFNKSGLDIQHDGMTWESDMVRIEPKRSNRESEGINVPFTPDQFQYNFVLVPKYSVAGCRKDSPCADSGFKKGDKIISINGRKVGSFNLEKIYDILKAEDGTAVNFELNRDGAPLKLKIILKDPIPYQDGN
ncbi:PDZ domain-containing protein [Chryseobacterium koreense]